MTDDLHARLLSAVQQRMDVARAAAERPGAHWTLKRYDDTDQFSDGVTGNLAGVIGSGDVMVPEGLHIAANSPATVLRHCERDMRVLERHVPGTDTDLYGRCLACFDGSGNELVRDCAVPWPCAEIFELAAAYGVDVDE